MIPLPLIYVAGLLLVGYATWKSTTRKKPEIEIQPLTSPETSEPITVVNKQQSDKNVTAVEESPDSRRSSGDDPRGIETLPRTEPVIESEPME